MNKAKIAIIYTGGTIGMYDSGDGLTPLADISEHIAIFFEDYYCEFINFSAIDSSDANLNFYINLVNLIRSIEQKYNAIIVLHGTDTMCFTANLFALIADVNIPIIFTGSQRSILEKKSDAVKNLELVNLLLKNKFIEKINTAISFGGKILNCITSSKISTESDAGIISLNSKELAKLSNNKLICRDFQKFPYIKNINLNPNLRIANFRLSPTNAEFISEVINKCEYDAIILETYGNGNLPNSPTLLDSIKQKAKSIPIMNISQCPYSSINMNYKSARHLQDANIILANKCNFELAHALLLTYCSDKNKIDINLFIKELDNYL